MEKLPLEIITRVAENLEVFDIHTGDRFAHVTETSTDCPVNWFSLTEAAPGDIRTFRLVCRRFCNASFKSFATVLGERRIRITKVGLEDLKAITKNPLLVPYLTTLTFGNARFLDPGSWRFREIQELLSLIADKTIQDRLERSYETAAEESSVIDSAANQKMLIQALRLIPNLQCIRVVDDSKQAGHLGGWLTPHEARLLQSTRSIKYAGVQEPPSFDIYQMESFTRILVAVGEALVEAGIKLQELRFGKDTEERLYFLIPDPYKNIRVLRCVAEDTYFDTPNVKFRKPPWNCPIRDGCGLVDVSYTLRSNRAWRKVSVVHPAQDVATKWLVKGLSGHQQLKRLSLDGVWTFALDDLMRLVGQAGSLQYLLLRDPSVSDCRWCSAVNSLRASLPPTIRLLKIMNPWEIVHGECKVAGFSDDDFKDLSTNLHYTFQLGCPRPDGTGYRLLEAEPSSEK